MLEPTLFHSHEDQGKNQTTAEPPSYLDPELLIPVVTIITDPWLPLSGAFKTHLLSLPDCCHLCRGRSALAGTENIIIRDQLIAFQMPPTIDTPTKISIVCCKINDKGASLKRTEFSDQGVNRPVISELTIKSHKPVATVPAARKSKVIGDY
ncbi:hypothetical protein [Marinobacter sp. OP 3.4]|uniref:hypothetical protein n=1 Tax=Marinobacter sp. OP 3.4 TaxID=3076501 RepID=UPI002E1E4779